MVRTKKSSRKLSGFLGPFCCGSAFFVFWKYSEEEEEHFLDDDDDDFDGTKESVHHRLRASFHRSLCIFCRGALSRECFRRRRR